MVYPIDNKRDSEARDWTTGRLKEEFFLCLVKAPEKKYYSQAKDLMFRIPLTQQYSKSDQESVPFIINFSDLTARVQAEFKDLCIDYDKAQITLFLKEVVIRLFENLNYEYTHMSVLKKLRVSIVR